MEYNEKTSGNQPEVIHQSKNEQYVDTVVCGIWVFLTQVCH
jgi:hypothetical protein